MGLKQNKSTGNRQGKTAEYCTAGCSSRLWPHFTSFRPLPSSNLGSSRELSAAFASPKSNTASTASLRILQVRLSPSLLSAEVWHTQQGSKAQYLGFAAIQIGSVCIECLATAFLAPGGPWRFSVRIEHGRNSVGGNSTFLGHSATGSLQVGLS